MRSKKISIEQDELIFVEQSIETFRKMHLKVSSKETGFEGARHVFIASIVKIGLMVTLLYFKYPEDYGQSLEDLVTLLEKFADDSTDEESYRVYTDIYLELMSKGNSIVIN